MDFKYKPQGEIEKIFESKDTFILVEGPAGTGKTLACLFKVVKYLEKYPGSRALLMRKTRNSLNTSGLVTLEEFVLPKSIIGNCTLRGRQNYRFPNGSVLEIGGLDKTSKTLSSEYNLIMISQAEEITYNEFNELKRCLRFKKKNAKTNTYKQMLLECNPSYISHWLNCCTELTRIKTTHKDNPRWYDIDKKKYTDDGKEYINDILGSMTGNTRERLLLGNWSTAEGVVFDEWLSNKYVINRKKSFGSIRRIGGIDWGYKDPTVVLVADESEDGVIYITREIYKSGLTISDVIIELKKAKLHNVQFVCDSAEPDKIVDLRRAGFDANPIKKQTIQHGIELIKNRIRNDKFFYFADALVEEDKGLKKRYQPTSLLQEFDSYSWSDKKFNQPMDQHNHAIDALRYLLETVDKGTDVWLQPTVAEDQEEEKKKNNIQTIEIPIAATTIKRTDKIYSTGRVEYTVLNVDHTIWDRM